MSEWENLRPKPIKVKAEIISPKTITKNYGFEEDNPLLWVLYLQHNPSMPEEEQAYIKEHINNLKLLKRQQENSLIEEFEKRKNEYVREARVEDIFITDVNGNELK